MVELFALEVEVIRIVYLQFATVPLRLLLRLAPLPVLERVCPEILVYSRGGFGVHFYKFGNLDNYFTILL